MFEYQFGIYTVRDLLLVLDRWLNLLGFYATVSTSLLGLFGFLLKTYFTSKCKFVAPVSSLFSHRITNKDTVCNNFFRIEHASKRSFSLSCFFCRLMICLISQSSQ